VTAVYSVVVNRPPAARRSVGRLAWLEVLRGWAALLVALHHATYIYLPGLQPASNLWFDPGRYGVLLFFLVSGYLIPASLERGRGVRAFWTGRFFRLYPLLVVACLLAVMPFLLRLRGLRAGLERYDPLTVVLAHLTMMQDLLGVPNAMNVLWTLSYEMAFYLLVVALFVLGWHRGSAPVAIGLVALALPAGVLLPAAVLSPALGTDIVVAVAVVTLMVAIVASMTDRPVISATGGVLGGLLAVALVTLNPRIGAWEGMVMLAVMFTGSTIHRAQHGQVSRGTATWTVGTVLVGGVVVAAWNIQGPQAWQTLWTWSSALALAAATFATAWALRDRRFPRWAVGLGTVSFSVYLLHPLLLMVSAQFLGTTGRQNVPGMVAFTVVLLTASWASHRWIESPAQRLGLARRSDAPRDPTVPASSTPVHNISH
jgi:peptidoglycan/LPS O-acetylase OafA/YrhL